MKALILAGGEGVRLRPLTYSVPKPLLPIKGKPILEIIIERLASFGIDDFILATGYRSYMIEAYFLNGSRYNVKITYQIEQKRMGTAAPLKFINSDTREPILVMNGDVLTDLDFKELIDFHLGSASDLTFCTARYKVKILYGVVDCANDNSFLDIVEKPVKKFMVNAGIYIVNPELISIIPESKPFNMTDLIIKAKELGKRVLVYEIRGKWIDIGLMDDYRRANKTQF
ncbi:MAG: sugar phosphate nucleotidyltransferase [Actinobacteria bacterium]|nr:sugar phosphate nucleotidyltransferase [Actinomycetota bacterium]